ncbi:tRNA(m7G46)-methyltransferase [Serratia symbiotica str. 'Cinara cedri']|nr:tRNA(m7G46)-methyltransferase [Serratia symbiotica str. 'Cinara cedri']
MIHAVISSQCNTNNKPSSHILSFVRRQRRLTKNQKQALHKYWSIMGVEYQDKPINVTALFNHNAPITLEIGFGMGRSLVTTAKKNPQKNFLGIEVYLPGISACLADAYAVKLNNLRVICHDAVEVLQNTIPDDSLDAVQLFFPDPWHKKRHNKRRIVQLHFVHLVLKKLKMGGIFHVATDSQPYAEYILEVMNKVTGYYNLSSKNNYLPRPNTRPLTKFELRSQILGHSVWDLMFKKNNI